MRCLLVEDEPDRVARILPELRKIFGEASVDIARDRDSAITLIDKTAFDLIVLDQRIPTAPGQLDANVIHGRTVLAQVRQIAPDTPVYFLTGLPMEDLYVDELIAAGAQRDIWGDRKPVAMNRRFQKATMGPFYEAASDIANTARITDEIEINTKGAGIDLSAADARLLRVFARRHDCICIDIAALSGGLSSARTLRADIKNTQGDVQLSAVSKLGHHNAVAGETQSYGREIIRLPAGTYAPLIPAELPRVLDRAAVFYRLLDGYDRSLFAVLKESDTDAAACVKAIRDSQAPWAQSASVRRMRIGELVKLVVREDRAPAVHALLAGIDYRTYEDREISIKMCTRHGDLHGENVLVDSANRAMLIDYGSVKQLPSAFDAVTLELSPFFHPDGVRDALCWGPGTGNIDWFDREAFCALSTVPAYIRATREWAHGDGFGDREALASAYMYVLWQLQFPGVYRELAIALLTGIVARATKT